MPLGDLSKEGDARVVSAFERDRQLLEYFDRLGIRPGATLQLLSQNYDDTITLMIDGHTVPLGRAAANKVWVEPVSVAVR